MLKQISKLYRKLLKSSRIARRFSIHKNRDKRMVLFPHDESFLKDQQVQWWYWTGNITTSSGKKLGYEVVFFVFDSWVFLRDILAQVAITDEQGQKFHFREDLEFMKLPKSEKDRFTLNAKNRAGEKIHASGGEQGYHISFDLENMHVELDLKTDHAPIMRYGGKAHHYCYGGYTYYYSREIMESTGTITIDGKTESITGETWYDRQYGDLFQSIFKGWQWFSIKLDSGKTIMVSDFFDRYKQENFGSITDENGSIELGNDQFSVATKDFWKSPNSGTVYPIKWELTVQGELFMVIPVMQDQELSSEDAIWIGPEYWEGDCYVQQNGVQVGKAYVELNGFGKKLLSIEDGVGI